MLFNEFAKRLITALVLCIIIIGANLWHYQALMVVLLMFGLIATRELWQVASPCSWLTKSCLTILLVLWPILLLHCWRRDYGPDIIFYLLTITIATDCFAYFCGKLIGGPKLAPKISPNKTISGALGGMIAASLISYFTFDFVAVTTSILLCLVAVISDLIESYLKRRLNIKDTGALLPGHGGLFDRVDSLIGAVLFAAIIGLPGYF